MNLVLRDRMDEYEATLKDFDFEWRCDEEITELAKDVMKATEWRLLIEAEMIGPDAVMMLRKYQTGMA